MFFGLWLMLAQPQWHTDYNRAATAALESNKPLLIYFHQENCPPCRAMRRTLNRADLRGYVCVSVDTNLSPGLVDSVGVVQTPSVAIGRPNEPCRVYQTPEAVLTAIR